MKEYVLLTIDEADYEALCDTLNALPFGFIRARVTPTMYSWAQWGATKEVLGGNIDAVEAVYEALLDTVGVQDEDEA